MDMIILFDLHFVNLLRFLNDQDISSFSEMQQILPNSRTLSKKLKILRNKHLIIKQASAYKLTEKGTVFFKSLQSTLAILDLSNSLYDQVKAPFVLRIALQRYINILQKEFQDQLASVVLFGSLAVEKYEETSDIDLFILIRGEINVPAIFERFMKCRRQFRKTHEHRHLRNHGLAFRVQHVPFSMDAMDSFHNLWPEIITSGIVLVDVDEDYKRFTKRAIAAITERGLLKVQDIHGNVYWRSFKGELKEHAR